MRDYEESRQVSETSERHRALDYGSKASALWIPKGAWQQEEAASAEDVQVERKAHNG